MYENDNAAIQNLQGQLIHLQLIQDAEAISQLFHEEQGRYETPDDGVVCSGRRQIREHFRRRFEEDGHRFYVMSHTPAIAIADDGQSARASWYASTFRVLQTGTRPALIQGSARYDADLVKTTAGWRYRGLQFYYMMTLEPNAYLADGAPMMNRPVAAATGCTPDARTFRTLANRMGRWCQDRRDGAGERFVRSAEARLELPTLLQRPAVGVEAVCMALEELKAKEQALSPYPMQIAMIAAPYMAMSPDKQSVCAHWVLLTHEATPDGESAVIRACLSQLSVRFVWENSDWKFYSVCQNPLLRLPDSRLLRKESEDTIFHLEGGWVNGPEAFGNDSQQALADTYKIEEYIAFWVSGLRYRSEAPFYYQRLDLEEPERLSYRVGLRPEATGLSEVTKRIFGMTNKFATYQPKSPGNHVGTTPVIEVLPGEAEARATWLDYGWTTAAEVFGITAPPYFANPAIGRYEMRFSKVGGVWKLYYFRWTPFFRAEKWTFDYATTKGWSGTTSCKRFPLPLDPYIYENDPARKGEKIVLEPPMIDCPYEQPWTGELDKL